MNQIDKNTVKAENQLKETEFVSYYRPEGGGIRVLFVGNSITRHGVCDDIGWHVDWGMAASAQEKDYVHLVAAEVLKEHPDAAFCICQAAEWERNCYHGEDTFSYYREARNFGADVIVMRLVENCPQGDYDGERYREEYGKLLAYLNPTGQASVIITTGFWKHIADGAIREFAERKGYAMVELNDLGEADCMKALGLFAHSGVANHPGDLGMQAIADRILEKMRSEGIL